MMIRTKIMDRASGPCAVSTGLCILLYIMHK